jgi:methionine-gamma-lyase
MKQHSKNASYLAEKLKADGVKLVYPGFENHPGHDTLKSMLNEEFGYGGMILLDVGSKKRAYNLMEMMQLEKVGYLAVSLGFYKTLFSAPGSSTSSEIPEDERIQLGLSEGLVRMSVGLDNDIERTYHKIKECMERLGN